MCFGIIIDFIPRYIKCVISFFLRIKRIKFFKRFGKENTNIFVRVDFDELIALEKKIVLRISMEKQPLSYVKKKL